MSAPDAPSALSDLTAPPLIRSPAERLQGSSDTASLDLAWRVVALANLYRLLLPPLLCTVYLFTRPTPTVGGSNPELFFLVSVVYWILGGLYAFGGRGHWPNRRVLVLANTLLDSAAVSALLYCSGGAGSGLGILLVIPVGAMAMLGEGRYAFGNAAIASLGILVQQIFSVALGNAPSIDYPLAGLQGAVVFVVALLAWPVSARLRESEAMVRRAVLDLANLAQVSQYIVQHLRESILVVDPDDYIRLINESAAQVLGEVNAVPGALLGEASPRLLYLLSTWRANDLIDPAADSQTLLAADGGRVIRPHFAPLGDTNPSPVIVFLEDTGAIAAKVQQTKLAALGRLSASIAHEIRNPVGAMSHAAQLLAESPAVSDEDRRLTQIMQANSRRVSGIIDNVMQLSRREAPRPEDADPCLMGSKIPRRILCHVAAAQRAASDRCRRRKCPGTDRRQPIAPDHVEPVPQRRDARTADQRRCRHSTSLRAPGRCGTAISASVRPRPGHRCGRRGTDFRAIFHPCAARHRSRIVPRTRAGSRQRRDAAV